mgnify:CR=1 FL=1
MTGRGGRGRPRKSAADRNDQRRRIVESARTTIGAHGPSTSIGDIAAAAGVSKPLIYAELTRELDRLIDRVGA